jgi:hypothetical protein
MSAVAYATPIRRPREHEVVEPERRHVRIVTTRAQRKSRPKLVYALWASVVIFAIFLAQLMITIALSSGAYQISGLQVSQQNLSRSASALGERLDTLASSQNLAANAKALGMVGSAQAAFLRLSDGAVLGAASPAGKSTVSASTLATLETNVSNSLLNEVPLINGTSVLSAGTGTGHGSTNSQNSSPSTTESTQGQTAPARTGTTKPASSSSSNSDELPSPVTH